jgi:repressor LexA
MRFNRKAMDAPKKNKPGPVKSVGLTKAQEDTFAVICRLKEQYGVAPTVREIAAERGVSAVSALEIIQQLEAKGYLRRGHGKARAIEILDQPLKSDQIPHIMPIQVIGRVAAGHPILAIQDHLGEFCVDAGLARGDCFALQICGDSMVDIGIHDKDYVVVRSQPTAMNGEVVVALIDDEATCKTFYQTLTGVELRPENPEHEVIYVKKGQDLRILGKVIAIRKTVEVKTNAANGVKQ